jgi:hypothetical protein
MMSTETEQAAGLTKAERILAAVAVSLPLHAAERLEIRAVTKPRGLTKVRLRRIVKRAALEEQGQPPAAP